MTTPPPDPSPSRGRPRQFDEALVLEQAMHCFWTRGFEATSLEDLSVATGLARQSLYRTFGNKRALFLAALAHYGEDRRAFLKKLLAAAPPKEALFQLIAFWEGGRCVSGAVGCLNFNALAEFAQSSDREIRERVVRNQEFLEDLLSETIARGQGSGELPRRRPARAEARSLVGVAHTLANFRRFGVPADVLRDIADGARAALEG